MLQNIKYLRKIIIPNDNIVELDIHKLYNYRINHIQVNRSLYPHWKMHLFELFFLLIDELTMVCSLFGWRKRSFITLSLREETMGMNGLRLTQHHDRISPLCGFILFLLQSIGMMWLFFFDSLLAIELTDGGGERARDETKESMIYMQSEFSFSVFPLLENVIQSFSIFFNRFN